MKFLLPLLLAAALNAQNSLPPWSPGHLDLHQIHTGRGNALLAILPSGTAILIDAGEVPDGKPLELGPRLPNSSKSAGEWIAEYVKRFAPKPALDYLVVSHYHDDHMGGIEPILNQLPIGQWLDRGTKPPPPLFPAVQNYLSLRQKSKIPQAAILPGTNNQFPHLPNFDIRTVAANGLVWTGTGSQVRSAFPPNWQSLPKDQHPNENHFSIAFRIRYGPFTYFTGADLIGVALDGLPSWHDIETPVAKATGPVDVAVINHHGWLDTTNEFFLRTLAPKVAILPAWHASHPDHGVLRRLVSPRGPKPDLFTTALLEAPAAIFRYLKQPFKNTGGHIVVRVAPGGKTYQVFVLDAAKETAPIIATHGPYQARGTVRR
jgi:hypothetical protein